MSSKLIILVVVVVVAVAAVVGIKMAGRTEEPAPAPVVSQNTPAPKPAASTKPSTFAEKPPASKMSKADMQKLSQEDLTSQAVQDKLGAAAVDTAVVDISGCEATPNIVKVKFGKSLKIQNKDNAKHVLTVGTTSIATIQPNSEQDVPFTKTQGVIGYACDGNGPIGLFLIQ